MVAQVIEEELLTGSVAQVAHLHCAMIVDVDVDDQSNTLRVATSYTQRTSTP
jgi:hypothetical protein